MYDPLLARAVLDHPLGQGSRVYQDCVKALDRLLKGEPEHPDSLAKLDQMASDGDEEPRLPVIVENVVMEAGCNRKALIGAGARYPRLKEFIGSLKTSHGVSPTTTALIERLQQEVKECRQLLRVLRSRLGDRDLELQDTRRALERERKKVLRLKDEAD